MKVLSTGLFKSMYVFVEIMFSNETISINSISYNAYNSNAVAWD